MEGTEERKVIEHSSKCEAALHLYWKIMEREKDQQKEKKEKEQFKVKEMKGEKTKIKLKMNFDDKILQ